MVILPMCCRRLPGRKPSNSEDVSKVVREAAWRTRRFRAAAECAGSGMSEAPPHVVLVSRSALAQRLRAKTYRKFFLSWPAAAVDDVLFAFDAGMAGLMTHGLGAGAGAADLASLPTPLVPSAPPVDGVQPASRMLGVQPTAAVPKAPLVRAHAVSRVCCWGRVRFIRSHLKGLHLEIRRR